MALTESWLKAQNGKPRNKVEEYADRDGMSVRISAKGKAVFQLRYRFNKKAQRFDVGTYPLMSLKDARLKVIKLRQLLDEGKDPKLELKVRQDNYNNAVTFEQVFSAWFDGYCIKYLKSSRAIQNSFNLHVLPVIGDMPIEVITLPHWFKLFEAIFDKSPNICNRLLVNCKQILKWAKKRGMIEHNILNDISARNDLGFVGNIRTRVLNDEEIALVWEALDKCRMFPKSRIFVKLCLMFGCRNGELRLARKQHFDLYNKVWTVPVENNKIGKKTGKTIVRPILPEAEELIVEAMEFSNSDYLFTAENGNKPLSGTSVAAYPVNLTQWIKSNKGIELPNWVLHDLRRTVRTNLSSITSKDIAEIILGHTVKGIVGVYDHYDYLPEQTVAYQAWFDRLQKIIKH